MIKNIFILTLFCLVIAGYRQDWIAVGKASKEAKQCQPFGVRLSWGRSRIDATSAEKLQIRFNTNKKCYGTSVLLNNNLVVACPSLPNHEFNMQQDRQKLISYTHICSLTTQIQYEESFVYNIFDEGSYLSYFQNDIKVYLKNPNKVSIFLKQNNRQVRFIHFADWGKIKYTQNRPSINKAIQKMLDQNQIDSLIINGDIAYDLHSSAEHLFQFMEMLESIAKKVPVIFNRGNHEVGESGKIFCTYFQVYGLCERNSTALSIGPAYLSLFDPQAALIPRIYHLFSAQQIASSQRNLVEDLQKGINKTILSFCHYPLICSYPTARHCIPYQHSEVLPLYTNLSPHFNALLDFKVPVVYSGHIHVYQRSDKILRGYRFQKIYKLDSISYDRKKDQFLIHVVSGVGGSDTYLDPKEKLGEKQFQKVKIQRFVSSWSFQKVGFDLIEVTKDYIDSKHIEVNIDYQLQEIDHFKIILKKQDFTEDDL